MSDTPPIPELKAARELGSGWSMMSAWAGIPGLGSLPVSAFLLKGAEPMLVDTNLGAVGDGFMRAVESQVDFADIKWIWLSHMDWDHIGNLRRVLAAAPNATVIANGLGMAKLGLVDIQPARVRLVNPGESVEVGGRRLTAMRPVYYDAPETMGFFDETAQALFAADSFGALFPGEVDQLDDVAEAALCEGMTTWSSVDAPWLGDQSADALGRRLAEVERLEPKLVLSAHLPAAKAAMRRLAGIVGRAYRAAGSAYAGQGVGEMAAAGA